MGNPNQTTAIAKADKPRQLQIMAERIGMDPDKVMETLKATVFSKATNEEFAALVVVANEYKLNPFLKQIFAFPKKGGGIEPMVPIDGWIKIINDQPTFDGMEIAYKDDDEGRPYSCTCTIHRSDKKHPTIITEFVDECFRNTEPWNGMPRRMIRHKAIMQCGRVAFGLSGIVDEDEARDIERRELTPVETTVKTTGQLADQIKNRTKAPPALPEPKPDPVCIQETERQPAPVSTGEQAQATPTTTEAATTGDSKTLPVSHPDAEPPASFFDGQANNRRKAK